MRIRQFGLLAIFAVLMVLFAGCGGGDGGSNAVVQGVWTGSLIQTRAVGGSSAIQLEFYQNGSNLTGTAVTTKSDGISISALTGTVHGSQIAGKITTLPDGIPSVADTKTFTGTVSDAGIQGAYTTTTGSGSTGGNFTITRSNGGGAHNLTAFSPLWVGTVTPSGGSQQNLSFNFSQARSALTFTGTIGGNGSTGAALNLSGTGAIIGNQVTLLAVRAGTTTAYTGTYDSGAGKITGTANDFVGNIGAFSIFPAQTTAGVSR